MNSIGNGALVIPLAVRPIEHAFKHTGDSFVTLIVRWLPVVTVR